MTKKILFRLDVLGIHFGIAKYIQEDFNHKISAIIDVNNGKTFYQKQKIVNFENIWFFGDSLKNIKKQPDLVYLKYIESKYKINLWKLAYGDQLFFQYNDYYQFTDNEILCILENACKFYENVLNELNPDYLFIRLTDNSVDHLLSLMCHAKRIPVFTFSFSRLGNRYSLLNKYDQFDAVDDISYTAPKDRTLQELREYVTNYSLDQQKLRNVFRTSKLNWLMGGFKYLKITSSPNYTKYYKYHGRTLLKAFYNELRFYLKRKFRKSFIDKHLDRKIDTTSPFVYFPLHQEPERTLLISAPFFANQLELIINIARSLPPNFLLYVKEHPFQKVKGWREISKYKQIMDLPNVKLIHPSVSNMDLIAKSELVLTVTGSSALESALNNKPSVIFSDTIFSELSCVYRVLDITNLSSIISNALKTKIVVSEINNFIFKLEENSFDFHEKVDLEAQLNNQFHYGGFLLDTEYSEEDVDRFLKENEAVFKKLSFEHNKKIMKLESFSNSI